MITVGLRTGGSALPVRKLRKWMRWPSALPLCATCCSGAAIAPILMNVAEKSWNQRLDAHRYNALLDTTWIGGNNSGIPIQSAEDKLAAVAAA
jgi:hypothetical protein